MNKYYREHVASFDVDPEQGFTPLCPDELPVPGGHEIVDALLENHKFGKVKVVSKDAHSRNAEWVATEENPQFSEIPGDNTDIRWNSHCNVGENGFELLPGLPSVKDYNFVVYKGLEKDMHPYGACYHDFKEKMSTGAIEYLKSQNIKLVVVGGLALDFCVKETVRQLMESGFDVVLNLESTRHILKKEEVLSELTELGKNTYCGTFYFVNTSEDLKTFMSENVN